MPTALTVCPPGPTSVSGVSSSTISMDTGQIRPSLEGSSRLPNWPKMTAVLRSFNSQLGTMLETSGVMTSPVFRVRAKSVGSNVDGKYGQLNSTGYPSAK